MDLDLPVDVELVADVMRVLVAEGVSAKRTGEDRFEAGDGMTPTMEWCCVGGVFFGRELDDVGEAAWRHRVLGTDAVSVESAALRVAAVIRGVGAGVLAG